MRESMTSELSLPDPAVVVELIEAFRRSKTMFAAVSLGVFDLLVQGPRSVASLAQEMQLNADALERLLDSCVSLQLLTKDADKYQNAPVASTYLCRASPRRLTGYIQYSNAFLWGLWAHLEDAVREGSHRWQQAFGWEGPMLESF